MAHNGNSELILANLGVKEQEDRFVVKHYLTLAIPLGELEAFESALETATQHSILAVNKHLDSIGEQLGKIVLLDEAQLVGQADANMNHAFGILLAHVGSLQSLRSFRRSLPWALGLRFSPSLHIL